MNINDLETKHGPLPEHLSRKDVETLLKKQVNPFPLIDNLYEVVSSWLISAEVSFSTIKIEVHTLSGGAGYLTGIEADKLMIVLVDDYKFFNKKNVAKNIAGEVHKKLQAQGYRIVWCKKFEWENTNKREVMKSLILHVLGKTKQRYFARKTVCDVVQNKDLVEFFNNSSFYGFRGATNAVVLRDRDSKEILQALNFGHAYYGKDRYGENCVECIRSAGKRNAVVVGGMSKLIKFYIDKFGDTFDTIVYYVDDAHHQSDSMEAIGFKYSHFAGNAVHNVWAGTGAMFMRTPALHQSIKYMQSIGEIYGVPDVGNSIYTYKKENNLVATEE